LTVERMIIISVWVLITPALILFIPKRNRRKAVIVFLAAQVFSWSLSLILVEAGWVVNPVHEFSRASTSDFTFNYALYPTLVVFFSQYFPRNKRLIIKWLYSLGYISLVTGFVEMIQKHTQLIHFKKMSLSFRFCLFLILFYLVYQFGEWFFRKLHKSSPAEVV